MEPATPFEIHADTYTLIAFVVYLTILVLIGVLATRFSSKGINEFFIGGRKMKSFVVALSAVVSGRSAWLILGVSGIAYTRGIFAVWAVVGYILVELFMFLFVAKRLRRFTGIHDNVTIPDFFESRFVDKTHILRITSVCIILVFMVAYVAAQFNAGGKTFAASFGLEGTTGILITGLIVLIYTVLGGFLAVSLTDVVQGIFMIIALVLLPVVAISDFGGLSKVLETIALTDGKLVDPLSLGAGALIGFLGIGLGSPGNPHILVRYMSIEDPKHLRVAALVGTVWNTVMAWGAIYIGLAGRAFYPSKNLLPGGDTEKLFPYLASVHLHPVIYGFVIAAIFAAIMSTTDSQLLVAASGIVRDIYQKLFRREHTLKPSQYVSLSRVIILVLVVFAVIIAVQGSELIFWLVLFAWAGLGASFGPALILSLFWKRTTGWGVFAGMVSGTIITIVWNKTPWLKSMIYELIPAFFFSTLLIVIVSLFTRPPENADAALREISARYKE